MAHYIGLLNRRLLRHPFWSPVEQATPLQQEEGHLYFLTKHTAVCVYVCACVGAGGCGCLYVFLCMDVCACVPYIHHRHGKLCIIKVMRFVLCKHYAILIYASWLSL